MTSLFPDSLQDASDQQKAYYAVKNFTSQAEFDQLTTGQQNWVTFYFRQNLNMDSEVFEAEVERTLTAYFNPANEEQTPKYRVYARAKLRDMMLCRPDLVGASPDDLWALAWEDYIKDPEYKSPDAVAAREAAVKEIAAKAREAKKLKREAKKAQKAEAANVVTELGPLKQAWREAVRNRNLAGEWWKDQYAQLLARHEAELVAFRGARKQSEGELRADVEAKRIASQGE